LKLIKQKAENTPLQKLTDRCQQAEGESFNRDIGAGNGTQLSMFFNIPNKRT